MSERSATIVGSPAAGDRRPDAIAFRVAVAVAFGVLAAWVAWLPWLMVNNIHNDGQYPYYLGFMHRNSMALWWLGAVVGVAAGCLRYIWVTRRGPRQAAVHGRMRPTIARLLGFTCLFGLFFSADAAYALGEGMRLTALGFLIAFVALMVAVWTAAMLGRRAQ